jgi:hypothetical protein
MEITSTEKSYSRGGIGSRGSPVRRIVITIVDRDGDAIEAGNGGHATSTSAGPTIRWARCPTGAVAPPRRPAGGRAPSPGSRRDWDCPRRRRRYCRRFPCPRRPGPTEAARGTARWWVPADRLRVDRT